MKRWCALMLAMAVLCGTAIARAEDADVTGEWYGFFSDLAAVMTLQADGAYSADLGGGLYLDGGRWTFRDGRLFIYGQAHRSQMTLAEGKFSGTLDGISCVFERKQYQILRNTYDPAPARSGAPLEAFAGDWRSVWVASNQSAVKVVPGRGDRCLSIESGEADCAVTGGVFSRTEPVTGTYDNGTITVSGHQSVVSYSLLEDGTLDEHLTYTGQGPRSILVKHIYYERMADKATKPTRQDPEETEP